MKKFFYLLSVAMMTIGCTKSFEPATESNSQGTVESQTRLTIFTATIGASGRVDLGDKNEAGYPLQWEDGDQITITDGTNQGVYALESVDANGVGSFVFESGAAVATDAEQYTAWCGESASYANGKFTYTVPSTQTYAEGHHLAGKIPLFAQSTTTALSFQTPIAIVRLNLRKEEPVGVNKVVINGHFNNNPTAGTFTTAVNTDGSWGSTTVKSGISDLTFEIGGVEVGSEGKSFYLMMPARTYTYSSTSTTFDMEVAYTDGGNAYFKNTKNITTKAGVVMPISLGLKKECRPSGLKLYDLSEATTITFKARSNEDFSDTSRFTKFDDISDSEGYPAYVEWTGAEGTDAIVHTAADSFMGREKALWFTATGNHSYAQFFLNLRSIDFGDDFDTSQVKTASGLFSKCHKLETVRFGKRCTFANATTIGGMFSECTSLTELDLTTFDFSKVSSPSLDDFTGSLTWGGRNIFNTTGQNAPNKPIQIKVSASGFQQLEKARAAAIALNPDLATDSSDLFGAGEGTSWQLVNADATE